MRLLAFIFTLLFVPVLSAANVNPGNGDVAAHDLERTAAGSAAGRKEEITYGDKGRIVKKFSAHGSIEHFIYHPKTGKLILVLNDRSRTAYHYNDCGKLSRAANGDGQVIDLTYHDCQLIRTVSEFDPASGSRRVLKFKYNAMGKPVKIKLAGVGELTVAYDDNGEIRSVSPKGGAQMVLHVTRAFHTLSTLVRKTEGNPGNDMSCKPGDDAIRK